MQTDPNTAFVVLTLACGSSPLFAASVERMFREVSLEGQKLPVRAVSEAAVQRVSDRLSSMSQGQAD